MKNICLLAACLALAAQVPALAEEKADKQAKSEQGSGPNPYVECGIGAAIFKDTSWAAATSNVTWDLGSTALTSATSSPEMCSKKNVKAAMLIRDSYAQISEETARGQGEHLSAALEVFGCNADRQSAAAVQVRSDFSKVLAIPSYSSQSQVDKAAQMFNVIHTAAQGHCGA